MGETVTQKKPRQSAGFLFSLTTQALSAPGA